MNWDDPRWPDIWEQRVMDRTPVCVCCGDEVAEDVLCDDCLNCDELGGEG